MKVFTVRNRMDQTWDEMQNWMYDNVDHGGFWLRLAGNPYQQPEPEPGDSWGYWHTICGTNVAILDKRHALMFSLRWVDNIIQSGYNMFGD